MSLRSRYSFYGHDDENATAAASNPGDAAISLMKKRSFDL